MCLSCTVNVVTCTKHTYRCHNGLCVSKGNPECDGEEDCSDGSDEKDCGEQGGREWSCRSSTVHVGRSHAGASLARFCPEERMALLVALRHCHVGLLWSCRRGPGQPACQRLSCRAVVLAVVLGWPLLHRPSDGSGRPWLPCPAWRREGTAYWSTQQGFACRTRYFNL